MRVLKMLKDEYALKHLKSLEKIIEKMDHAVSEVDGNGEIILDFIHSNQLQSAIDELDQLRSDLYERLV